MALEFKTAIVARISRDITAALLALVAMTACALAQPRVPPPDRDEFRDRSGAAIRRAYVVPRDYPDAKIEYYWSRPFRDGPWPAVVFIHGFQEEEPSPGGFDQVRSGNLGRFATLGYVAVSVSQPGFGRSAGPPDYTGPKTQAGVRAVIDHLRAQSFVMPDRVGIVGYSRGAMVAAMVATQDSALAAVVLGAGVYDFATWYPSPLIGINANIRAEMGTSKEAFRARSAMEFADRIKSPVLILHGVRDERIPVRQAEAFEARLKELGAPVTARYFPNAMHSIPFAEYMGEVGPFLAAHLKR